MTTAAVRQPAAAPRPAARDLIRACGGPRYAAALAVDALGTGLLRPFLLIYGIKVLTLSAPTAGAAMTAGIVAGLAAMPGVGRWLDRGARSSAVAAAMAVRVLGTVLLLLAPIGNLVLFALASLFLGIGNQAFPAAHAAVVATVSEGRVRDAALAAGRSLRNAGLGVGALLAAAALAGGTDALRTLAAVTGATYLAAALLAASVRIHAGRTPASETSQDVDTMLAAASPAPRGLRTLLAANVIYVFCLNVPEIALPLVLVTRLHASPVWAAAVFVANTVLVVTLQVPVTVWAARYARSTALALSGLILTGSYLAFLLATPLPRAWAVPVIALISVPCTLGEILYAGSATALVTATAPPRRLGRELARFQLSSGFGLAVSPAVITALAAVSPAVLWGGLAAATLVAAGAVGNQFPDGRRLG